MNAPIHSEKFVAAVEAIYDAAPDPSQWPRALTAIANVFEAVGGILIWQKEDGAFGTITTPSLKEANDAYRAGEWWTRDTAVQQGLKLGYFFNGEACTNRHFASDEMRAEPYMTEFLIPHGLGWLATIAVSPDPRIAVAMSIHRNFSDTSFSEQELGVLAKIARHVENLCGCPSGFLILNCSTLVWAKPWPGLVSEFLDSIRLAM